MHRLRSIPVLAKNLFIGVFLLCIGLIVYKCKNPEISTDYYTIDPIAIHRNGNGFAGSTSCIACHNDIYATHSNTAHFKTSTVADTAHIKGSFKTGENTFTLNERAVFTLMETDSGFYQRANFIHNQLELFKLPIDIVFGSVGQKGSLI